MNGCTAPTAQSAVIAEQADTIAELRAEVQRLNRRIAVYEAAAVIVDSNQAKHRGVREFVAQPADTGAELNIIKQAIFATPDEHLVSRDILIHNIEAHINGGKP